MKNFHQKIKNSLKNLLKLKIKNDQILFKKKSMIKDLLLEVDFQKPIIKIKLMTKMKILKLMITLVKYQKLCDQDQNI